MYTGQHFTSFSGSVRESERQGVIERKIFVEAGNTLQLPPPTPAAVLLAALRIAISRARDLL